MKSIEEYQAFLPEYVDHHDLEPSRRGIDKEVLKTIRAASVQRFKMSRFEMRHLASVCNLLGTKSRERLNEINLVVYGTIAVLLERNKALIRLGMCARTIFSPKVIRKLLAEKVGPLVTEKATKRAPAPMAPQKQQPRPEPKPNQSPSDIETALERKRRLFLQGAAAMDEVSPSQQEAILNELLQ